MVRAAWSGLPLVEQLRGVRVVCGNALKMSLMVVFVCYSMVEYGGVFGSTGLGVE